MNTRISSGVNNKHFSTGFSLVELMVTIGIFAFISILILANYPRFASRLLFNRKVQEISQHIRRAQTYSIGVRGLGDFESPYGIYFSMSAPQRYIFFADRDSNKMYDLSEPIESESCTDECVEKFILPSSAEIVGLCKAAETLSCQSLNELHITFKRPAPTTFFHDGSNEILDSDVEIIIENPRETDNPQREIIVWKTGQISIESIE